MILPFVIVGLAAATFLPHALPRFAAGRVAAIFLLGVGANGAMLFALGLAGVPLRTLTFAAVPLISLAVAVLRGKRIFGRTPALARAGRMKFVTLADGSTASRRP